METTLSHDAFLDRLNSAAERFLGIDRYDRGFKVALAKALGTTGSTVQRWYSGSFPEASQLVKIYEKLGIRPDYLLGIESKASQQLIDSRNITSIVGFKSEALQNEFRESSGFVIGPILKDSKSVCNPQSIVQTDIESWAITKDDMVLHRKNIIGLIVPERLGMSMYPIIKPGDIVLIDCSDREVIDGGIYALKHDHEGCIIRQLNKAGKSLILIPWYLKEFRVEIIDLQKTPDPIIGKIIASFTYFNFPVAPPKGSMPEEETPK